MKKTQNWLILWIVSTTATVFACRSMVNTNEPPTPDPPIPSTPSMEYWTATPSTSAPAGQCDYTWAYYDVPGLSKELESSVQAIEPSASAFAQAAGEDCVYSDGQTVFTARQTDFSVRLPVTELTNEAAMGDWIAKVMPIVMQLPPEQVQGSMPGNIEFAFVKNDAEQIHLWIAIHSYPEISEGKTGIEIFRFYHIPPTSPT